MPRKGMSTSLKIVITLVILLVVALVVLTIFSQNIGGVGELFQNWISSLGGDGGGGVKSCSSWTTEITVGEIKSKLNGVCSTIADKACLQFDYVRPCPSGKICCLKA